MTYRTAKMPLNIISERLRWWRKQDNVARIEAYVNDCTAWLVIKFGSKETKETQAQRNERLIRSLPLSSVEAKKLKLEMVLNQIKEEQE